MSKLTSQLEIRLQDQVSASAKKAAQALGGLTRRLKELNGTPVRLGDKIHAAITRNNVALGNARLQLADAVAGVYVLNRTFGASVRSAGNFQEAMNKVGVLSGASGEQISTLTNQAKELGRTTQFTATQAGDAMGFLAMAGFKANEIMGAMPATLQLASASGMDLASSADIVSNVLAGYGMKVEELGRVNDVLVGAFTSANTDLTDLGVALKYAGPVASAAGMSFEEAAAALGLMGNAGIQGSMAGTSLRGAISRILSPTKEMQKAMEKAGLQFTDTNGRLLPLSDIITQLEPHADDAGLMMELFGQRAGPAMAALVSQGSDALVGLTRDLENSGGKAKEVSDVKMEGFNGKMRALRSAADGLSMAIGESLLPGLTALAEKLTAALGPITAFAAAHPELTSNVAAAAGAVVSFKLAMAGLKFVGLVGKGGALSMLSFAFNGIGGAAGGAKKAATEMVALQAALAGMDGKSLGALSRFKFALKGIAMSVPGVAPLGGALTAIGTAIGTISLPVWGGFAAAAAAVAAAGLSIYKYWDRITSIISGVGRAIGEELAPVLQVVQPALDVFAPIGQAIADGWASAKAAMSGVMDWIGSAFSREILNEDQKAQLEASGHDVAERIIAAIKQVPEQLKAVADEWMLAGRALILSLWEGMKQVFAEMTAWLQSQLSNIGSMASNALSNVPLLGRFVGGGNNAAASEETPARAGGGPISRGQTYMVGEKGPELITANRNGYVNPAGQGGRQASSASLTVNAPITINGVSADPAQLGAEVARQIREQIGEAFRGLHADAGMRFS